MTLLALLCNKLEVGLTCFWTVSLGSLDPRRWRDPLVHDLTVLQLEIRVSWALQRLQSTNCELDSHGAQVPIYGLRFSGIESTRAGKLYLIKSRTGINGTRPDETQSRPTHR
jgi:hypothetical protein